MQNIVDIIIIIFILLCGVVGYKRGVFKQLVLCVGLILIFYLDSDIFVHKHPN